MDKYFTDTKFWEERSKKYNQLQWTHKEGYLDAVIDMCELSKKDDVLCMGTGPGLPALYLCHKVRSVIGIDSSESMLKIARKNKLCNNTEFILGDIRQSPFQNGSFSRIVARMVFHHLTWGLNRAFGEAKRLLKPNGLICISEGIPPDRCVEEFYKKVFSLKEKRRTFFPQDLRNLLLKAGFNNLKEEIYIMRHCSIRNWVDNAGNLSTEAKEKIYQMHINLHDEGKKAYNMHITPDDCFIDMKFIILSGRKSV